MDVAEYIGNVPAEKREEVIQQLNKEVEKLIKVSYQSISTTDVMLTPCHLINAQDAVPVRVEKKEKGKLIRDLKSQLSHDAYTPIGERVVNVGGVGCPCGGTHVKNTADIRGVTVTKIKKVM